MNVAFFDTKPYDRVYFDKFNKNYNIKYFESKLNKDSAVLAKNCKAVVSFVNDNVDKETIDFLYEEGVELLALRSAGYSHVDVQAAFKKIHVVRVPEYSPYAVAEHAMGLLLSLNRKIHKAYNRTRDFNFSLNGLIGFDLNGKTVGVIGTGKIGRTFIKICKGFGMNVIAYDLYPAKDLDVEYVPLEELFKRSDVISLHCPLTPQTKHILNKESFSMMKKGVYIINTSRGELIESQALLDSLSSEKVGGAGLDVYEEESDLFFEDFSFEIIKDDILSILVSRPNVIITSHQAFFTKEALENIAKTTFENLDEYFSGRELTNEVCYRCDSGKLIENCKKSKAKKCF